ncbi:MAG TPA: plastocyanin/azurin family copper-binding protein [Rhodanobacteraceae bacterium]|nr:plastocyanin/azurin family copper-binding protein [Rhodanobacteraceae bacterium]
MRPCNVKTWPVWMLLLLVAVPVWAANHNVSVGGSTNGDPYYGGGGTPILMFNPANLTITVGDTVTFINSGGPHNVHADDESFRCARGCDGQGGDGDPIDENWTSVVTFDQPGTFGYHCDTHGGLGMVGSITVQAASGSGNVPITAGFTGNWYDPSQSGHGFGIEVLEGDVMLLDWYVFAPDGGQAWVTAIGAIDGDTAVLDAATTAGSGALFPPNYDASQVHAEPWGTITLTFTDCNHGEASWQPTAAGYTAGSMPLVRLTQPAGLSCP